MTRDELMKLFGLDKLPAAGPPDAAEAEEDGTSCAVGVVADLMDEIIKFAFERGMERGANAVEVFTAMVGAAADHLACNPIEAARKFYAETTGEDFAKIVAMRHERVKQRNPDVFDGHLDLSRLKKPRWLQ